MKVLSLFDGISCGRVALERAGIEVEAYYSSEIDEKAMSVAQRNYPDTIQLGTVLNWRDWDLPDLDLVMGGSPCQGFSIAGKRLNFDDPRSRLFFEFVNVVRTLKPRWFLLENVNMKAEWRDIITEQLGVQPILINSNLVSAQNRPRLYWTNIPKVTAPDDKRVFLKDIVQNDVDEKHRLKTSQDMNKDFKHVDVPFAMTERRTLESKRLRRVNRLKHGIDFSPRRGKEMVARTDMKMNCLTAAYSVKEHTIIDNQHVYRKLTPIECERLQTLPDDYTAGASDLQRYKMLGNGWTVDVIAHILSLTTEEGQAKEAQRGLGAWFS